MKIDIRVNMITSQTISEEYKKERINRMLGILKEIEKMSSSECNCSFVITETN